MKRLIIILFLVISNCHAILSQDENFVVFFTDAITNAVPVLDYKLYKGKYWIKTVVIKDKRKIIGWTTNYCPNPYDSCT